ncbi:MAG: hypothetical protein K9K79_06050 [Desulfohalobiaceae bacterium]|nr:hypothetical protein [Desulfohalobiaceae bacterium]
MGSSLLVQPAASLPVMARENGAKLAIINKDKTPLDSLADVLVNESAAKVLGELVK